MFWLEVWNGVHGSFLVKAGDHAPLRERGSRWWVDMLSAGLAAKVMTATFFAENSARNCVRLLLCFCGIKHHSIVFSPIIARFSQADFISAALECLF